MKTKLMIAIGCLLLLCGCGPEPTIEMARVTPQSTEQSPRFQVTRVAVFEDGLAYGGRRGIYVIVDTKTGTQFIGVSGVGISETGSHTCNKTTISDER